MSFDEIVITLILSTFLLLITYLSKREYDFYNIKLELQQIRFLKQQRLQNKWID